MIRELTPDEKKELYVADPYVFYRCTTELMGEPADPPYRPVMDMSVAHPDIRHRVRYMRGSVQ